MPKTQKPEINPKRRTKTRTATSKETCCPDQQKQSPSSALVESCDLVSCAYTSTIADSSDPSAGFDEVEDVAAERGFFIRADLSSNVELSKIYTIHERDKKRKKKERKKQTLSTVSINACSTPVFSFALASINSIPFCRAKACPSAKVTWR